MAGGDAEAGGAASGHGDGPAGNLALMRVSYAGAGLAEADLAADWVSQFGVWMEQAVRAGVVEPNAMVLATASADGVPASRTVLAKSVDADGVTFYTNYSSAKSADLLRNPLASLTFPWISLHRQVHVMGRVHQVDRAVTEAYWATRPRASQLGAWASPQSTVLAGFPAGQPPQTDPRSLLDELEAATERRFGPAAATDGDPIPAPPHWGGWCVVPETVEFWQGRLGRLHDRLRYRLTTEGNWVVERLAP